MASVTVRYPIIGGTYKHYKGGVYTVLTLATHSETQEPLVIYQSELFGSVFARPLSMWFEQVETPIMMVKNGEAKPSNRITKVERFFLQGSNFSNSEE